MGQRWESIIRAGSLFCGFAVLLGAFGAHALKDVLPEWYDPTRAAEKLEVWRTAVLYQLVHGVGLLFVGLYSRGKQNRLLVLSGYAFGLGIFLFSGDLYLWVISDISLFAMVVPLGGLSLIFGWLCVFLATWTGKLDEDGIE